MHIQMLTSYSFSEAVLRDQPEYESGEPSSMSNLMRMIENLILRIIMTGKWESALSEESYPSLTILKLRITNPALK